MSTLILNLPITARLSGQRKPIPSTSKADYQKPLSVILVSKSCTNVKCESVKVSLCKCVFVKGWTGSSRTGRCW